MLDKSIPYKDMIMKLAYHDCDKISESEQPRLPAGFSFHMYRNGDMRHWCEIECSVLEFPDQIKAEDYFQREFLPWENELHQRMVFIVNEQQIPVATASAWWFDSDESRQASLHWVAVHPEYQRLGLGRAVVMKALSLFPIYEPDHPVFLHTQTWSHVAIRLYRKLGFCVCRTMMPGNKTNAYEEAMAILEPVLKQEDYMDLLTTSIP